MDMDHTKLNSDMACTNAALNRQWKWRISKHIMNVRAVHGAGWWGELWTNKEKRIDTAGLLLVEDVWNG
jgi:hypothetical protein